MGTNLGADFAVGMILNIAGLSCLVPTFYVWRLSRDRMLLLLMAAQCVCLGWSQLSLNRGWSVIWGLMALEFLWAWWKEKQPPRKRRFRAKAKALFRKIKALVPRPVAPTPVGA